MFWKKKALYVSLFGCLFMFSSLNPLWAVEGETARLINLLKSKNIIDQQEADQLLQEAKASAQKEQKEKEEMKAAVKDSTLPSALKGFKFSTTIFSEWNNKVVDNGSSLNQFNVNRAYFAFKRDINDRLGMNITADLFTSKDANDKGNGLELRLKYAYATLQYFGTYSELGLIHTPSIDYAETIWSYRAQGKVLLDDLGIQASADYGISNQGVFGGYMDDDYLKFAAKNFAGKWGGWYVGVFDGAGYAETEANNNKVFSGLIYVRPLPAVPVLKGLQIAYSGSYGKSNKKFDTVKVPGAVATDFPNFKANVVQVSLQDKLFTIMGQYYWGDGTANSTEDFSRKGYLADAFVRIPGLEKARAFGIYQYFDPNTDKDSDISKKMVAGLSYDVTKEFMTFIAYEKKIFDTAAAGADYNQYQFGCQLKF